MTDRRNPYLILGLDFGASAEQAAVAFARRSRRLRADEDAPYTIEDATWALHQIEQAEEEHRTGVTIYRVPADPDIFSDGSSPPAPQPLERTTPSEHDHVERLEAEVVADTLSPALEGLTTMGPDLAYAQDPSTGSAPNDAASPKRPEPSRETSSSRGTVTAGRPATRPQEPSFQAKPKGEVTYASPGKRFGAFALDVVILAVVSLLLTALLGLFGPFSSTAETLPALLAYGYIVVAEGRLGQTYGKHLVGVQVLSDRDGQPIGIGWALVRLLVKALGIYVVGLGVLWILGHDRRQGWHDLAVKSVVVDDTSPGQDGPVEHLKKLVSG